VLSSEYWQEGHRHYEQVRRRTAESDVACSQIKQNADSRPHQFLLARLLEVHRKLRELAAATSAEDTQNALLEEAKNIIQDICAEHVSAVKAVVKTEELQQNIAQSIEEDCQGLIDYIIAAKRFHLEVNARSKDRVVSFGEKLSCRFMAAVLEEKVCVVVLLRRPGVGRDNTDSRTRLS